MRAVNRYIIIEKLKEEPKPNKGGLILAEQHQNDIHLPNVLPFS